MRDEALCHVRNEENISDEAAVLQAGMCPGFAAARQGSPPRSWHRAIFQVYGGVKGKRELRMNQVT